MPALESHAHARGAPVSNWHRASSQTSTMALLQDPSLEFLPFCFRGGKRCVETARALHIWLGAVFALHNSGVIASNQIYGHAS
jgi:hypothetical protein